jgi:hypothetical protein
MEGERQRARRRILSALDEIVAQCTVQAELLERQDGAAPVLVTEGVVEWVRRVAQALVRYGVGGVRPGGRRWRTSPEWGRGRNRTPHREGRE